jgi:hypothetical protein
MTIKLARKKYDPDEIVHICEGIIDRAKDGKTKAIAIVEITDDNGLLYSAAQAMRCTQLELPGPSPTYKASSLPPMENLND